jgi:hypothetical protein
MYTVYLIQSSKNTVIYGVDTFWTKSLKTDRTKEVDRSSLFNQIGTLINQVGRYQLGFLEGVKINSHAVF